MGKSKIEKITLEVTKDEGILSVFIGDKAYKNTWRRKGTGWYGTTEKPIEYQLKDDGIEVPDEVLEAIDDIDVSQILSAISGRY